MAQTLEESVIRILQSPAVSNELDTNLDKDAAAQYSPRENKFRMGSHCFGFREWQSYVVHEATHAIVDMKKVHISKIDDEVVAHVAHTLYLRRMGFGFKSHHITNKTWYPARDVTNSIIRSGTTDEQLVKTLQETVTNDSFYKGFIGKTAFVDG